MDDKVKKYIDGFFGIGSTESTDSFKRDLLERLLSYESQDLTAPQQKQARDNIGVLNIDKFIDLTDTEDDYSDCYALIGDSVNKKITYSTVHGSNPGFFWIEKVCPDPSWSANILINGDFTDGNTGWGVPNGWSTASKRALHWDEIEMGALTQDLAGSMVDVSYKASFLLSIATGSISVTINDLYSGEQLGEAYVFDTDSDGEKVCLFSVVGRPGYQIRFTPGGNLYGSVDNVFLQIGDVGSNASPQVRGYELGGETVSPFELTWKGGGLYIGRNCGWSTVVSQNSQNLIISPDGFTGLTGGYNITAFGYGQGIDIKNQHDIILIGGGLTTSKSHNLKIGIGNSEIIDGDLLTLDLLFKGNVDINKNLTVFSANANYSYLFPDFAPLTFGQILQVGTSSPSARLAWSPYRLPVSLPTSDSVILISDDGTSSYTALHPPVTIAAGSTDYLGLTEQELSIDLGGFLTDQFWQLEETNWHYLPTNRAEIRPVSAQPETWIKNYTGTEWDDIALVGKFAGESGRRWEVLFKDLSPQQQNGDLSILNIQWDTVPVIQVNSVIDARNALWFRYGDTGTQYTIFNFLHQITNLEVYAATGGTATCRTRFFQNGNFGVFGDYMQSANGQDYYKLHFNWLNDNAIQAATVGHVPIVTGTIPNQTVTWAAAFLQGGNAFGEKAVIGTTDNQAFGIITNNTEKITVLANGDVQLDGNQVLTNTTNASKFGIIYKGTAPFIHNFNYGNNGTVTTTGGNLFIGENAGNLTMGATATQTFHSSYNVFAGTSAGRLNTTGYYNVFVGYFAGYSNTTGNNNVFAGALAGRLNTTGNYNVFAGASAGYSNTTGYYNVFAGTLAGYSNTTGYYNVFAGTSAGYSNTTGYNNVFVGYLAGYSNTTGHNNVFVGYFAGRYLADGATANETSNTSIFIGNDTRALSAGNANQIVIGSGAIGKGSNTVVLGNTSIIGTYLMGKVSVGITSTPTALIHIAAGTATAGTASLKIDPGTLLSTPESGAIESDGTKFYWTNSSNARKTIAFLLDNLNAFGSGAATTGQAPLADGSGGIVWTTLTASVPGTEALSGTSVTLNWNGTTTAIYAMGAASTLTIGTTANYVKRVKVTGNYALTLSGATLASGTYNGSKVNLIDFVPVDGVVYAFITNI